MPEKGVALQAVSNNLKQLGSAFMMYTADWDYFPKNGSGTATGWQHYIAPYYGATLNSNKVFDATQEVPLLLCPSDTAPMYVNDNQSIGGKLGLSYTANNFFIEDGNKVHSGWGIKASVPKNPSSTFLVTDGRGQKNQTYYSYSLAAYRHGGSTVQLPGSTTSSYTGDRNLKVGLNIVYADGHTAYFDHIIHTDWVSVAPTDKNSIFYNWRDFR